MKRILFILLAGVVLAACSDEEPQATEQESDVEDAAAEEKAAEPSQEELDAQLKEEAVEISFVEANGDSLEKGTKVKATGTVATIANAESVGGEFDLTTEENDGSGRYLIKNFSMTEVEQDAEVTVYGTYDGKHDSMGMPMIIVTIIE